MLNPAAILLITEPQKLFIGSPAAVKIQFHKLAKHFHPDAPDGHHEVFQHINELHQSVQRRIKAGTWGEKGHRVELNDGRFYEIESLRTRNFELGLEFIGTCHITWLVEPKHRELFLTGMKTGGFPFASGKMKTEIDPYLPTGLKNAKLKDGRYLLKMTKNPNVISLRDVLNHFEGRIPARHVVWIISSLMNLASYLEYAGISHQDISPDTYFIHPGLHIGSLLGGWWYAKRFGSTVKNVPIRTLGVLPHKVKTTKKASYLTDAELIRLTGREIIGNDPRNPKSVMKWLNSIGKKEASVDYQDWSDSRNQAGPRKFVKLHLTPKQIYGGV